MKLHLIFLFVIFFSTLFTSGVAAELKQIILLETMDVKVVRDRSHWFQVQMKELGYIEGVNMELSVLKANGSSQLAESLLKASLIKRKPNLVVTNATLASKAGVKILHGTTIPQLFVTVSDPVGSKIVKKIGVPTGNNITGRVHNITRETKVRLVLKLIGNKVKTRPIRFGYIHSTYPSSMGDIRQLKALAENNPNITFVPYKIPYREFPKNMAYMLKRLTIGLKELEGQIDFLWEPLGPFAESIEYNKLLKEKASVPVVFGVSRESVQTGALMYLAPDAEAEGREIGVLADRILKGENPGTISVIPPIKFNLGLNITTAQKMDIIIPPEILKLAKGNIFR